VAKQVFFLVVSFIRLMFSILFALPGTIMLFPLSTSIQFYAERERIKALKGSTVKINANDVLASAKIVAYMGTFPIYLSFFTYVFNRILRWYFEYDRADAYLYTLAFFVLFPIVQLISIRSHDGVKTHYSNFQGRFLSLFYTDQVDLIKSTRKALKQKVRSVVDRVGPQVFKNFDKMRLIMFDP
jgi:glycerol-3-phosphate O-acyltransferase / dihydroxyacetone phosphate acyltransferase